jgi:UDP-apiose/xylose synthase
MRIVVFGAGGFIGSHLVGRLLARDTHDVVGVDLASERLVEVLDSLPAAAHDRWTFHSADVRHEVDLLRHLVRGADAVVNLFAFANPSVYVTRPLETFDLNFVQNLAVARLCVEHGAWLIQFSSAEVYGKASGAPYDEHRTDAVFGPVRKQRWIYAASKDLLERVIYAHGDAGELRYTIIRPFNFVGPRMDYLVPAGAIGGPRVFPHFMSALLTGGPIRLVDGGYVRRAFLHIDDGTRAVEAILDDPARARNGIFNVGNPANELTIRRLADLMVELYEELTGEPARSPIEEIDGEAFYGPGYEDSDREAPDISRIRQFGWSPRHDLRTTLRETMTYYLSRRGAHALDAPLAGL